MKTRLAKLISLFLAALLCLMSCTSDGGVTVGTDTSDSAISPIQEDGNMDIGAVDFSGNSDTAKTTAMTDTYTFLPISEPGNGWTFNAQKMEFHNGKICIHMNHMDKHMTIHKRCIAFLETDGSISQTVPYELPTVDYYPDSKYTELLEGIRGSYMIDENTFLHTSYTNVFRYTPEREEELQSGYLMLCDAAGNILSDAIIPGKGLNSTLLRLHDGKIALIGSESICIFDDALNLTAQIGDGLETTLFSSPRGELFSEGKFLGTYYRIDPETYTHQAEQYYIAPKNITGISRMFFSPKDSAYEVYFTNQDGFWGYNVGEAKAYLLCSWSNSGLVYDNLTVLGVLDEHHILLSLKDPFPNESQIGWLLRNPIDENSTAPHRSAPEE